MVNEIVEAARSRFPPLILVIITPMINRLFKALKAKACRLLLFFSLRSNCRSPRISSN